MAQMGIFGLNIKAKVSNSWQTLTPRVKAGGGWQSVRMAWVKVGGIWQPTYQYVWEYTFASGEHTDVDLDNLSGIDKFHHVTITIPAGATLVASSTSAYALKTGTGYGGTLKIINNGKILGRGGAGGTGGQSTSHFYVVNGSAGANGGPAIYIECPVTIDNNGLINGGAGGGAGGGGAADDRSWPSSNDYASGGGGGGGAPYGAGGAAGSSHVNAGGAGSTASLTAPGNGGGGTTDGSATSGAGGAGGSWGQTGASGGSASRGDYRKSGGAGGTAGPAYDNPDNFTVTQV